LEALSSRNRWRTASTSWIGQGAPGQFTLPAGPVERVLDVVAVHTTLTTWPWHTAGHAQR
jgi:hypothetical protein